MQKIVTCAVMLCMISASLWLAVNIETVQPPQFALSVWIIMAGLFVLAIPIVFISFSDNDF